jgi:hypothetical protein
MKKRVLCGVLWFFTGWYAGAMIAYFTGTPTALGPILGIAAAALIGGDPRGIIWRPKAPEPTADPNLTPNPNPA